jgi:hypothetical protein
VNTSLSRHPAPPRTTLRRDPRLDTMTRRKLEGLAATFQRSHAAVLRQVMRWGLSRGQPDQVPGDDPPDPVQHLFVLVDVDLHQQIVEAAKGVGMEVAPWLCHTVRLITPTDIHQRRQAGHGDTRSRAHGRSHDSRTYGKRFMLRLDDQTRA